MYAQHENKQSDTQLTKSTMQISDLMQVAYFPQVLEMHLQYQDHLLKGLFSICMLKKY